MKSGIKLVSACVLGAALASGVYFGGMALADEAKAPVQAAAQAAAQVAAPAVAPVAKPAAVEAQDIVATLAADAQFSKLSGLIKDAGLADTLKAAPAVTVFAPTDAAFAAASKESMEALVKDPAKLKALLLDHVCVTKSLKAADIAAMKSVKVASGKDLMVVAKDGAVVTVGEAKIVKGDIAAKNGTVQAIDKLVVSCAMPAEAAAAK